MTQQEQKLIEVINFCQANALREDARLGAELLEDVKNMMAIPTCRPQTHNFHIARHGKCQDCGGTEWMDAPAPDIDTGWVAIDFANFILQQGYYPHESASGLWDNEVHSQTSESLYEIYIKCNKNRLEESPYTFPTREEAMEWAGKFADKVAFRVPYDGSNNFYDDNHHKWATEAALAMYDWIVQQLKPRPTA